MPYTILGDLQTLELGETVQCNNPCCILTLDCQVMILDVMEVTNLSPESVIFKLPESMTPTDQIIIPVYVENSNGINLTPLYINTNGTATMRVQLSNSVLYTNGIIFNCADKYYNGEIGNNFSQGTSPLR